MSATRFERLGKAFDHAWRDTAAARWQSDYILTGAPVRLRIVGAALTHHVHAAIAHARASTPQAAPQLTIDLWDARATGTPGLALPEQHALGSSWRIGNGTFAVSNDGRFASHALGSAVVWLDRGAQRMVGWYEDGDEVSLHQRGKPLQMLLALWASDRGLVAIHSACVARRDAGVLIPGRSGAGKSTAALACLQAGFDYLGDDWIGIGAATDGTISGHGLYSSVFLDAHHARRFPAIASHLIPSHNHAEAKSLVLLADRFPDRLRAATTIRAFALPRLVTGSTTRVRPAAKRDALLVLLPSTVFEMQPRIGREGIDRLVDLVHRTPAYWLEIGSDVHAIPAAVDEILAGMPR